MNIILFTNRGGQVWNFRIDVLRSGLTAVVVLALACGMAAWSGFHLGEGRLVYQPELPEAAQWQDLLREQRAEVVRARETAQTSLEVLTMRIGRMQAQLLRLNALGERLVQQADLDEVEFDFDRLPPVGGPRESEVLPATARPDFIATLDELSAELEDRERKLTVLETLLIDRDLHDRVMPSGRPVKGGWLSSRYGKRSDPFTGEQEFHKGLDFAGKEGSGIMAVGDGVVTWSGRRSGYGKLVEINHGNGFVTRYGHNRKELVTVGDKVSKGEVIALMGSTGRSTGSHVHFEVLRHGKQVNPSKYLGE